MLKLYPGNTLLLTYQPLVIKKKIQGFLLAKKEQKKFETYFTGDFDNQIQTIIDFKISKIKNSWSEHEHIHCSISAKKNKKNEFKLFESIYYFPFKNFIPFRERIYYLYPSLFSTKKKTIFQMEILQTTLDSTFNSEEAYKKNEKFLKESCPNTKILSRCTIFWFNKLQQNLRQKNNSFFKGELLNGGCTVFSFIDFKFLHIKDNLILTEFSLWVNDRGFDDRAIKYGNNEKISYKLERVSIKNQTSCTIRRISKKYK